MAYDAARGVTVLFGGYPLNDETWEWDGTAWIRRVVSGPSARWGHSMAYDVNRGVIVLFGGYGNNLTYSDETWEWNGTAWTQRVVSGPTARFDHAMVYDAGRGAMILFGGKYGSGYLGETWQYGLKPCPADFDHNGFVNGNDYDAFAELFDVADSAADFNGDGFVNGNDYDEFADAFDQGC